MCWLKNFSLAMQTFYVFSALEFFFSLFLGICDDKSFSLLFLFLNDMQRLYVSVYICVRCSMFLYTLFKELLAILDCFNRRKFH